MQSYITRKLWPKRHRNSVHAFGYPSVRLVHLFTKFMVQAEYELIGLYPIRNAATTAYDQADGPPDDMWKAIAHEQSNTGHARSMFSASCLPVCINLRRKY
ncbi:jg8486 [Pararge aegeria aegeria]|uniref:Jg8486 protein n=1 Tax=Pararge aegeria aegeria TaxID=348720 RepID=A0A8S4RWB8_9NEOP|nr:jg8486 [Pararge aegeria aegeria]